MQIMPTYDIQCWIPLMDLPVFKVERLLTEGTIP
jgi:hypothetical protein